MIFDGSLHCTAVVCGVSSCYKYVLRCREMNLFKHEQTIERMILCIGGRYVVLETICRLFVDGNVVLKLP